MDFATKTITAGGGPRTREYTTAVLHDEKKLDYFRRRLAQSDRRELPVTREQLHETEERGNQIKPLRPNHSINTQVNIANCQDRWAKFAESRGEGDWKELVKKLSWERKGLVDSFLEWLLKRAGSRIKTESCLQRYLLETWTVYKKYTGQVVDEKLREYGRLLTGQLSVDYKLRREPAHRNTLGPGMFIYLIYFRIIRDRTTFNTGIDRLNDITMRIIQMFTGCRTHELAYHPASENKKKINKYHDKDDAFGDRGREDRYIRPRSGACWVCGELEERIWKVLCWEDIFLWIIRDPEGDGKDRLVMQVLLRWHKGANKEIRPTFFLFVEEKLQLICPISYIIAKALKEGVIAKSGLDCPEKFFYTKLGLPAVQIFWKKEFRHMPVFRRSEACHDGYRLTNEPITRCAYDYRTEKLGESVGLPDKLQSYDSRRGQLQSLDGRFPFPIYGSNLTRD